ncbi:MAG TPA: CPBP family glutamic-type intramembrane protease [Allosphingosinicella sp.]
MYWVLLAAILLALAWFVRNDLAEYEAFKALSRSDERQRVFKRWVAKSFLFFGIGSAAILLLLGRIDALWRLPPEFAGLAAAVARQLADKDSGDGGTFFLGIVSAALVGGGIIGAVVAARRRNAQTPARIVTGDIEPLFPRNREERRWTALLALNAGPSEELFFRLLLPLMISLAIHNAVFAFAAAAVLFGLIHLYQGWVGVLGTTVIGFVFTGLYLASGNIWVPAVTHSLVNLNSLWLRPWLQQRRGGG